ncbi:MAG: hypothetical protein DWH94_08310 [Planctomycetota bacterium]|nr:MAG: hypothetical protein DWH94_08310 [Planctomycetota bacterium]
MKCPSASLAADQECLRERRSLQAFRGGRRRSCKAAASPTAAADPANTYEHLGSPQGLFALAQAILYLAVADRVECSMSRILPPAIWWGRMVRAKCHSICAARWKK